MSIQPFFSVDPQEAAFSLPSPKFDTLSCTLFPNQNSITLTLFLPENYASASRVHVQFRVQVTAEDPETLKATYAKYSSVRFLHPNGETIDYGFRMHYWDRLNFDADVALVNEKPAVILTIQNAKDLRLDLTKPQIDLDTIPTEDLLGGCELLQMASARRLGMGYLFTTPTGELVMIDGGRSSKEGWKGDAEPLAETIATHGGRVSEWFLTHYHNDHIGAVIELLNNDNNITIDRLYYDFSGDADYLKLHDPVESQLISKLEQAIENSGKVKEVITPQKGMTVSCGALTVKVLNDAYFSSPSNVCNDSSVILKVQTPKESVLFLGDMGGYGTVLLSDSAFVKEIEDCIIVQMAHHGQEGVDEVFYRTLKNMRICLYAAQEWLFDCNSGDGIGTGIWQSMITRAWMRELDVRKTYNMIGGHVIIQ